LDGLLIGKFLLLNYKIVGERGVFEIGVGGSGKESFSFVLLGICYGFGIL
jgi:hypothetical protein